MAEEQTLEVTIQNIVFQSDQGTFCVFRGENRDLGAVSVVYKGIAPFAGEKVRLTGSWTEHPRFGRQFDCRTWAVQLMVLWSASWAAQIMSASMINAGIH